jgi:hypothetical protein
VLSWRTSNVGRSCLADVGHLLHGRLGRDRNFNFYGDQDNVRRTVLGWFGDKAGFADSKGTFVQAAGAIKIALSSQDVTKMT